MKEAGVEFTQLGRSSTIEEGPGPVPQFCIEQADFVCWDRQSAISRIHTAFTKGFWAKAALTTFTEYEEDVVLSGPASHFVVPRAR